MNNIQIKRPNRLSNSKYNVKHNENSTTNNASHKETYLATQSDYYIVGGTSSSICVIDPIIIYLLLCPVCPWNQVKSHRSRHAWLID